MINERVLMVDDELNVLSAYKRRLHKRFQVETAQGPRLAFKVIQKKSFAVVVSDLKMPDMDGIHFLSKVKEIFPDSIRIMLTGFADVNKAIEAVNEGNIFRFLTKPCEDEILISSIEAGLKQYRLLMAERELLEKTLKGSVDILTEILSLYHPEIFGKTMQLRGMIRSLARFLKIKSSWDIEIAAMLSPIGFVGLPPEIVVKNQKNQKFNPDEREILELVPEIGAHLLANIPRLKSVSRIIYYQNKRFDGSGFPKDSVGGEKIPLGARIIKPLSDLLEMEQEGASRNQAIEVLKNRSGWYDPMVLEKLSLCFGDQDSIEETNEVFIQKLNADELECGQILISDLITAKGNLLLSSGQTLSKIHIQRLRNYSKLEGIQEPVHVKSIPGEKKSNLVQAQIV